MKKNTLRVNTKDYMKKDLKKRIDQFNQIKYPKDNSKRIIIATLSVNSGRIWNVTKGAKDK